MAQIRIGSLRSSSFIQGAIWALRLLAILVATAACFIGMVLLWLDVSAPDLWVKQPVPFPNQVSEVVTPGRNGEERLVSQVTLLGPDGASIEAAVSRPGDTETRLPVIILIGGFDTGMHSVDQLSEPGQNVVIGYGYPDTKMLKAPGPAIRKLITAQRDAYRVPGQVATLAAWAAAQPWADHDRIVLIGVSLGAVLSPAATQAMATAHIMPAATVLAYGGADLQTLVRSNLRHVPSFWRTPAAWAIAVALRRLEPTHYLPELQGKLLLIHGADDRFIPRESAILLDRLAPNSTAIVTLPGGHILLSDHSVLVALIDTAKFWLKSVGAVN